MFHRLHFNTVLCFIGAVLLIPHVYGLDITYCSPENNAGSFSVFVSAYQSNGACQQECQASYAFAILQGNDCWCSNYAPSNQVSTSQCNQPCPGYPSDWCGSTDNGLYGYYRLVLNPSGTSGSVSATSSRTSSSSQTTSTSTSTSTPGSSQQSEVYTSVTTVTGEVRTVVVTPTPSATADATLGQSSSGGGGGSNVGKVVGIVLGVVLGVIAIIAIALWLWLRRRRQNNASDGRTESTFRARTGDSSPSTQIPSRQVSQLSSAGLLGSKAPRASALGVPGGVDPRSTDTAPVGFDRRSVGTDQRLNPYALYIHDEGRVSDVSLQDNQDYSRQLRVANPDP